MKTSVALCTYNGEKYIKTQLDSIFGQTVPVDEIVVCDDGSADRTCEMAASIIGEAGVASKLVRNPINLGYTKNFEQAMSLCSGDIIFLSDQDDIWMPDKVETVCAFFERHPGKDFVFTNAELVNCLGAGCYNQTLFDAIGLDERNKALFDKGYEYDVIGVSSRVTGATTALRSSFAPYCIPFPKTWAASVHDEMIAVSAILRDKIAYIDKCLIKYRLHENQTTRSGLEVLFKYPPKRIELATQTIFWHESIAEWDNGYGLGKLRIVYERFWIRYMKFSLIRYLSMLLSGGYSKYYKRPFEVFYHDIKGIGIRLADRFRRNLPKRRT